MNIPFTREETEVIKLLWVIRDAVRALREQRLVIEAMQGKCSSDVVYESMADLYGNTPLVVVSLAFRKQLQIRIAEEEAGSSPDGTN